MTFNMVQTKKKIHFKKERAGSVSNIKQVYNIHNRKTEMQQLLKFLDDDHYVSR